MTLDEAIKRSNRIAEKNEELHKTTHPAFRLFDYEECAKDSRQLVEWLKELQRYREAWKKVKAEITDIRDVEAKCHDTFDDYSDGRYDVACESLRIIDKHLKEVKE